MIVLNILLAELLLKRFVYHVALLPDLGVLQEPVVGELRLLTLLKERRPIAARAEDHLK